MATPNCVTIDNGSKHVHFFWRRYRVMYDGTDPRVTYVCDVCFESVESPADNYTTHLTTHAGRHADTDTSNAPESAA